MKRQTLFLFIPIFLVFFVWGFQAGNNLDDQANVKANNQLVDLNSNIQSLPNRQKNILIFIIDKLDNRNPDLIGVWLMSYMSSEPYATVLAIYPSPLQEDTSIEQELFANFGLDNAKGVPQVNYEFLDTYREANIWSDGYILIDLFGLSELITLSSGNNNTSTSLDNEELLTQIARRSTPKFSNLVSQALLLQDLCNIYTHVDSVSMLKEIRDLYPLHISSDLDPEVLLGDWRQFIVNHNGSFCVFPQKDILVQINQ